MSHAHHAISVWLFKLPTINSCHYYLLPEAEATLHVYNIIVQCAAKIQIFEYILMTNIFLFGNSCTIFTSMFFASQIYIFIFIHRSFRQWIYLNMKIFVTTIGTQIKLWGYFPRTQQGIHYMHRLLSFYEDETTFSIKFH